VKKLLGKSIQSVKKLPGKKPQKCEKIAGKKAKGKKLYNEKVFQLFKIYPNSHLGAIA
jgi:hypothetical protein